MGSRTWPALSSCKMQCSETRCKAVNSPLNDPPHEILLLILSSLSLNEAARTSVVSHHWKYMWLHLPVLIFQADISVVKDHSLSEQLLSQKRSGFMEAHRELRLIFDLEVNCQSDIDKWVVLALTKHVKKLELNFTPFCGGGPYSIYDRYTWPLECRLSSLGLHRNLASLTSLCLKYVNVTTQDIECVLLSCRALEGLCIDDDSINLTQIKFPHSSLQLKKLELVCLSFDIILKSTSPNTTATCNSGIDNPPTMTNLKHLELRVTARYDRSILGWASLIEASPVLEELTLKFPSLSKNMEPGALLTRNIERVKGRPLKSLKIIKHVGLLGLPLEREFLTYLVENSVMLKEVIHLKPKVPYIYEICEYAMKRAREFKRTLPQGVRMQQRAFRDPQEGDNLKV